MPTTSDFTVNVAMSESITLDKLNDAHLGHVGIVTSSNYSVTLHPDGTRTGTADLLDGAPSHQIPTYNFHAQGAKPVRIDYSVPEPVPGITFAGFKTNIDGVDSDQFNVLPSGAVQTLKIGLTATIDANFNPDGEMPKILVSIKYK
jgi:hypothetical protein